MACERGCTFSLLSAFASRTYSTSPPQPRRIPTTRYPSRSARIVIARMAGFKPGTSPPPVRMAIVPFPMVRQDPLVHPYIVARRGRSDHGVGAARRLGIRVGIERGLHNRCESAARPPPHAD